MNTLLSLLLPILLISTAAMTSPQEVAPIRNFVRISDEFCTGAQPRLEHLEKLKADGVKSILNLRPAAEHRAAEEEAKVKELGLRYFNIPVVFGEPKEEQVEEFLKITDDSENRPIFIHCAAGIRVAAFWMIRRVVRDDGRSKPRSREADKNRNCARVHTGKGLPQVH